MIICLVTFCSAFVAFSALTLMAGWQEEHPAHKKLSDEVLVRLPVCSKMQMFCMWFSWCHCHPITSCFSKIQMVLCFWYQFTQVVLEKRPLNGNSYCRWYICYSFVNMLSRFDVMCFQLMAVLENFRFFSHQIFRGSEVKYSKVGFLALTPHQTSTQILWQSITGWLRSII